jgi:hypothetical protein
LSTKSFKLSARVSSENPEAIDTVLRGLIDSGSVKREGDDSFIVEAVMKGVSAKDLNRSLLSELRRAEKKTRLRAEWTSGRTTEKYFDYVLKKRERADKVI